ncbi:retrotransposon protein [Cucumis melo var. makuwa]|uniref:Retrotransposon protein n=1 Tax=Cucumis melo var. makuwa TaxID=1194695 RepID=A0A5D3DCN7_CUCMM|nr:retrotransposon protein [Cucumis melo var. makuwa]TYK21417.1 retrotransposon protein [Cucumis melo var. makuwa]
MTTASSLPSTIGRKEKRQPRRVPRQRHPTAKELLNRSFSHYGEPSNVFAKDRKMGGRTETFGDVGSNELNGYERFVVDVAHDMEFQAMYRRKVRKRLGTQSTLPLSTTMNNLTALLIGLSYNVKTQAQHGKRSSDSYRPSLS